MWDRDVDGKVKKGPLAHLWEPKRTLGLSLYLGFVDLFQRFDIIQVASCHSDSITLDKYTFKLGYDDEFDMGEIAQLTTKEIAHFRRVCPGRRE